MTISIQAAALAVLQACTPADKLSLFAHPSRCLPLDTPGRPLVPVLVNPRELVARKLGSVEGRAVLLHAVAHIEFNAINLAWDAIYRFPEMPAQYYCDWASVAADEARHFNMLAACMQEMGYQYGDFPAHNGLWDMAIKTRDDVLTRMALVPRLLEARGLDVTPGMISKLKSAGDSRAVAVLETILREEVRHVEIGSIWFTHLCAKANKPVMETFLALLRTHAASMVRGPFNVQARLAAGFSQLEVDALALFHA
jgi:uncharacterized ferritin-like protein (DUF455 family)